MAPDVLLFAKGVANGLPLGGIVAERALMARWPTATHGTTFGGNPVSCAAALAMFDVLERDQGAARAARSGRALLDRLRADLGDHPAVLDVRGLGLMVGVELAVGGGRRRPAACLDERVLVLTCGPGENVLRLIPPLTISDDELALGLDVLRDAVTAQR